jgi:type II secretory pathway pseudopilin PulG
VEECDWEAYEPRIPEGEEDKGFAPVSARWRRAALLQHMEQGLEALPPVEQAQLARAREIESREEARVRQEEARANQLQQQQDAAAAAAAQQQQQQQQQQQDEAAASAQRWDSAPTATPPPPPPPRKSTDESTYHAQQYVEYAGVGPHCFHDAPPRRQPSMTEKHAQQVSAAAAAAAAAVAQLQVAHAQLQAAQHTDQSLALPPQVISPNCPPPPPPHSPPASFLQELEMI